MYRILAPGILFIVMSAPAFAAYTPLYAGFQLDNTSGTALLGYQFNNTYSVEVFATRTQTRIDQAGASSETKINEAGMAALFMFPMKLTGGSPYFLFGKAGYKHITKNVSYSFPASVTYSGSYSNTENQVIFGGGAQYDFYQRLNGRLGVDIVDQDRSVYLGIIFSF